MRQGPQMDTFTCGTFPISIEPAGQANDPSDMCRFGKARGYFRQKRARAAKSGSSFEESFTAVIVA
jgi:hypothetical protein